MFWNVKYLESEIASLGERLDATIIGNDRGYNQRYQAQEAAVSAALTAAEKAVNAALAAAEKAVGKAEEAANDRFEAANNVKAELDRKYSSLLADAVTRPEYETAHKDVLKRIEDLNIAVGAVRQDVAVGSPAVRILERSQAERQGAKSADDERFQRFAQKVYIALAGVTLVVTLNVAHIIK
jgi:hypothetical protein